MNTTQQIGGSLGTVLLNTIAVTVTLRALHHSVASVRRVDARDLAWILRGFLVGGGILWRRRAGDPLHARVGRARRGAHPRAGRLNQRPRVGRPVGCVVGLGVAGVLHQPVRAKLCERELTRIEPARDAADVALSETVDAREERALPWRARRTPR